MREEDIKRLVSEEISKSKLADEDIDMCEINLIEAIKTKTPADGSRSTIIPQAVEMLWRMWDDDRE